MKGEVSMYQYIVTSKDPVNISTPFCSNMDEIKQEIISRSVDCNHVRSTYPNGFVVEMIQLSDKIIVETNRELIDNGNGNFTVSD